MSQNNQKGSIEVSDLSVVFGNGSDRIDAVKDLSFIVNPGEFLCLLGVSGCGKSTILNALAGFVSPTSGRICVDGNMIDTPGPERCMVFQKHALFPWKTVLGNVGFGLKMAGMPKSNRNQKAKEYIDLVGLSGFEKRYPIELSGGMEQRVGLARALVLDPPVLLMDEPFGSLDAQTRMMMQELLLEIRSKSHSTVVFVTHDVDESILLADRILVLTARPGTVKEEIHVRLPRPRCYDQVTKPEFVKIKEHALALIREETKQALSLEGCSKSI